MEHWELAEVLFNESEACVSVVVVKVLVAMENLGRLSTKPYNIAAYMSCTVCCTKSQPEPSAASHVVQGQVDTGCDPRSGRVTE